MKVGEKATRSNTLTLDNVKTYAEITGDYNPLHFDEGSAGKTKFKELVAQVADLRDSERPGGDGHAGTRHRFHEP